MAFRDQTSRRHRAIRGGSVDDAIVISYDSGVLAVVHGDGRTSFCHVAAIGLPPPGATPTQLPMAPPDPSPPLRRAAERYGLVWRGAGLAPETLAEGTYAEMEACCQALARDLMRTGCRRTAPARRFLSQLGLVAGAGLIAAVATTALLAPVDPAVPGAWGGMGAPASFQGSPGLASLPPGLPRPLPDPRQPVPNLAAPNLAASGPPASPDLRAALRAPMQAMEDLAARRRGPAGPAAQRPAGQPSSGQPSSGQPPSGQPPSPPAGAEAPVPPQRGAAVHPDTKVSLDDRPPSHRGDETMAQPRSGGEPRPGAAAPGAGLEMRLERHTLEALRQVNAALAAGQPVEPKWLADLPPGMAAKVMAIESALAHRDQGGGDETLPRSVRARTAGKDPFGIADIPDRMSWAALGHPTIPMPGGGDIKTPDDMRAFGFQP